MNTVIFGKLYVTDGEITAHELTEVAETLVEADKSGPHVLPPQRVTERRIRRQAQRKPPPGGKGFP